jgi:predicted lipid-binding transport protein (Tim44 family)
MLNIIKSTLDFGLQGFLGLLSLIIILGVLVGLLAWLGDKYRWHVE